MVAETEEPFVCPRCGGTCESRFEYELELASGPYSVTWYRCPACGEEYLDAPDLLLRGGRETREGVPVGTTRKVALCQAAAPSIREEARGGSVGALVATALADGSVDAVLLPDYGTDRHVRVVLEPDEAQGLRRAWSTPSRSIPTNAGVAANLDFLVDLERFALEDRGAHPRVAVVGRPCHVFAARHGNLDRIAPGYEVPLAIGQFCYGNIAPGSAAARFARLTGLPPEEIRGMTAASGLVRVAGTNRQSVDVPLDRFASFLHKTCLRCVDFTVPWADLSLGEDPRVPGFDIALARSEAGERLFDRATGTGRLRTWSPPWMEGKGDALQILEDLTALKRELAVAR